MKTKLIILTAPSGAGKTTIAKHLLSIIPSLSFSISACTREKRGYETDGIDYYFFSKELFQEKISNNEFIEWEEVYHDTYYGTLKSEVERIENEGKHAVFDIDVKGALRVKERYKEDSLSVFIKPPSPEVLKERLEGRNTESELMLGKRLQRLEEELKYETHFDVVLINDELEDVLVKAAKLVTDYLEE